MANYTKVIPVKVNDDVTIQVEATSTAKAEEVAWTDHTFKEITDSIEGIVGAMTKTLDKVKPDKASVEFGVDISLESGKLTALLTKGSANASMKLTLEWEREK